MVELITGIESKEWSFASYSGNIPQTPQP